MYIYFRYGSDGANCGGIERAVEHNIQSFTDADIEKAAEQILSRRRTGDRVTDILTNVMRFSTHGDLQEYLVSGAEEIVRYLSDVALNELALYYLMAEKRLMPLNPRENWRVELDIHHSHGNDIIVACPDLMPYDHFMVVAPA